MDFLTKKFNWFYTIKVSTNKRTLISNQKKAERLIVVKSNSNDFRTALLEEEIEKTMKAAEEFLKLDYCDDEKEIEDVWSANYLQVNDIYTFINDLVDNEHLPMHFTVHYTSSNYEMSYEEMASRIVVFDGLKVVHAEWFENIIQLDDWEYRGIKEDGLRNMVEAMWIYHHFGQISDE